MNLAAEFEKLRKLSQARIITQEEYERSKNRLLDECVRHIESLYVPKPPSPPPVVEPLHEPRPPVRIRIVKPSSDRKPPARVPVVEPLYNPKPPDAPITIEPLSDERPPARASVVEPLHDQKPLASLPFIEPLFNRKPPAGVPRGLPPVKVVCGIAQNIRLSLREDHTGYAAFVEIDGEQVEISSSSSICVEPGDRVVLSGYERDGRLLALAYQNESKGTCSNLSRVRKGYRFFLAAGRASWLAGIAALVGTLIVLIGHQPVRTFNSGLWRYVPYALSSLAAAATCALGLCLSFLGARAKEFYDALPWAATGAAHQH